MTTKLGVILIISETNHLSAVLTNLSNQLFKDWNLYLLTTSHLDTKMYDLNFNNYKIISSDPSKSIINNAFIVASTLMEDYICIINSFDIHHINRFNTQVSYLDFYRSINICSCLESVIFKDDKLQSIVNSKNSFVSIKEICTAISCNFIPLNLYTMMFRKSFLCSISKFSKNIKFSTEIELILYLLRYENIIKLPLQLYYINNTTSSSYLLSNEDEKITQFNESNFLNNQSYFQELINKNIMKSRTSDNYEHTIVIVLDKINIGGTETYIINLSRKLKEFNINVCILSNYCFSTEVFTLYDIPLYVINLNDKVELKNTLLKINNIKQIQIHMENDISLSPYIKELIQVPIILTIHGIYYAKKTIIKYISNIDYIIFVSKNCYSFYSDIINSTSTEFSIISNSIDVEFNVKNDIFLRNKLNLPKDSLIILYCSRLSYNKSKLALIFLKSFYKLAKRDKNIYAVILGDGNHRFEVESLSNKLNNALNTTRIFILGNKFNVLDYYSESDLIIGTGRVALESMSIGKAVISFGLSKSPYIINTKNINKLIHSNFGDHPNHTINLFYRHHLTKLMKSLISSEEYRMKLGLWNKLFVIDNLSSSSLIKLIFKFLN